jgi:hypothetical protein
MLYTWSLYANKPFSHSPHKKKTGTPSTGRESSRLREREKDTTSVANDSDSGEVRQGSVSRHPLAVMFCFIGIAHFSLSFQPKLLLFHPHTALSPFRQRCHSCFFLIILDSPTSHHLHRCRSSARSDCLYFACSNLYRITLPAGYISLPVLQPSALAAYLLRIRFDHVIIASHTTMARWLTSFTRAKTMTSARPVEATANCSVAMDVLARFTWPV